MQRNALNKVTLLFGLIALSSCRDDPGPIEVERRERIRGAWFAPHGLDGYLSDRALTQLDHLKAQSCDWVAIAPEPTMEDIEAPEITWAEDDKTQIELIRRIRDKGLKTLLFPRIESPIFFEPSEKPKWRGNIAMKTDEDWDRFHQNLEEMLVHYAKIAEAEGVELFCLGLEYRESTSRYPKAWRRIIKSVREVYSGPVVYSANWHREFEELTFWDALDYIGIGAYFPIADRDRADVAEMTRGWMRHRARIRRLVDRFARPVIFTEIGYPNYVDAGRFPWDWTNRARDLDPKHQADCFRAFFRAFASTRWLAGLFVWRYHTDPRFVKSWEYSPQGKAAEEVIRSSFARENEVHRARNR